MPYLTEEEYNELEKELAWYKSLHATTMIRTWDDVAFELRAKNAELLTALKECTDCLARYQIHYDGVAAAEHSPVLQAARAAIAKAEGN